MFFDMQRGIHYRCKEENFPTKFEMKDLGMMQYFLGMEVWQSADGIFLSQGKYVVEILKRFGMLDCNVMATPIASNLKLLSDVSFKNTDATMYHKMIGSLMYLMNIIPYICFAVNILGQFITDLIHVHLMVEKHAVRYLKGTIDSLEEIWGLKWAL